MLAGLAAVAGPVSLVRGLRVPDPFIDPRLFRHAAFASAALISALTGYGLATAIVGAAVFVDRVLYGGPDEQRLALGALAGAAAVGGARCRGSRSGVLSLRFVTLVGLGASVAGLLRDGGLDPGHVGRERIGLRSRSSGSGSA